MNEKPHQCNCDKVSRCNIFIHPDKGIQAALNNLMDAMAIYDDNTSSKSILFFQSINSKSIFRSISKQTSK